MLGDSGETDRDYRDRRLTKTERQRETETERLRLRDGLTQRVSRVRRLSRDRDRVPPPESLSSVGGMPTATRAVPGAANPVTGTALAMYLCYQCHIIYTDEKLTDPVRTRRGIRPAPRMRTHSVN